MAASTEGAGEVCPQPIGSAMSRPEMSAKRWGMKSARGARSSARRSSRSSMPLVRIASVNWARSSASDALTGRLPIRRSCSPLCERLLEPQAVLVVGEIEPERRHRNLLRGKRREIRAVLELDLAALEHQPIIGNAAPVPPLFDPHQLSVALALAGEGHARHLASGAKGEVHIDKAAGGNAGGEDLA